MNWLVNPQESSIIVTGKVKEEPREVGGFELDATDLKVIRMQMIIPLPQKNMDGIS